MNIDGSAVLLKLAEAVEENCDDGATDGVVVVAVAVDNDGDDDDNDKKADCDGGGVTEPLDDGVAVAFGVTDIDDCMVELNPFDFCCCFSFSGITIRLG